MEMQGLIHAFIFDGRGGARPVDWAGIRAWQPEMGPLWVHLDYSSAEVHRWIQTESHLDEVVAEALLSEETRPRTTVLEGAALLALRGVNMSPGSDPEDMVSIRVWANQQQIISTRRRRLLSTADIAAAFEAGKGPKSTGEFIEKLSSLLIARMEGVVEDLEDRAAQIEEQVISGGSHELRTEISAIRRETIMLRRYLAPQREAMIKLYSEDFAWLSDHDRIRMREATDQLIRHIEDLDSIRDRASVTQEELVNRLTEQLNTRMYVLSLVAAVFLPLGFLTGLMGVNVGGIPGAESSSGFAIFVLLIVAVSVLQVLYLKGKRWL